MKEFSECYRLCKRYKEVLGLEHQEYYVKRKENLCIILLKIIFYKLDEYTKAY